MGLGRIRCGSSIVEEGGVAFVMRASGFHFKEVVLFPCWYWTIVAVRRMEGRRTGRRRGRGRRGGSGRRSEGSDSE